MSGVSIWKDPHHWWDIGYGKLFRPTLLQVKSDYTLARDAPRPEAVPPVPQPFIRWNQAQYGGKKFLNDYWKKEYEKNPSMDHLVFTVELVFGDDTVLLLANKDIETASMLTGDVYAYYGALIDKPSFKHAATVGSSTSRARTFKVTFPNKLLDAVKIIQSDRMLAGYAEVSLQVRGGDYDKRWVMMRGSMDSGVNFGNTDGETVSVTIVDPKLIMSGSLPPYRVPESYPLPDISSEPRQPFMFSPHPSWYPDAPPTMGSISYFYFGLDHVDYPQWKAAMVAGGAYTGRAFPPAAGIGRTYPLVWNYYPRVPCVPLVRDPHAVSSEFGGPVDEAYIAAHGIEDGGPVDFNCFYVAAYGHGHKFKMFFANDIGVTGGSWFEEWSTEVLGHTRSPQNVEIFLTVPQIKGIAEQWGRKNRGITDPDEAMMSHGTGQEFSYEYSHASETHPEIWQESHVFVLYEGGEMRLSQDPWGAMEVEGHPLVDLTYLFPCILMEVYDPNGVPITVLRMSPKAGTDYTSSITIPMISSTGSNDLSEIASTDNPSSIINCIKYFAKSFTTLGHIALDEQLFANAQSKLSNMSVSGIVNGSGERTQAQTLSFIESQLLKPFPMISMSFTGRGYGPVVFDRRNPTNGEYTVGQSLFIDRISNLVETPKTKMFNDYTLRYSYDFEESTYKGVISRNSGNNIFCKISEEQAGRRTKSVVDSNWVYDRSIAEYCIDWHCSHSTLPSYSVTYLADVWTVFRHEVGDNIKITDPKLGITDCVATITSIKYTPEACEVTLILWLYYTKLDGGATNYPLPTLEGEGEGLEWLPDTEPQENEPQG